MKKKQILHFLQYGFLLMLLCNCINPYEANIGEGGESYLVVDGSIVSDTEVTFNLSRTYSLNEPHRPNDYNDIKAVLRVTGSDGSRWEGIANGKGSYRVVIGTLKPESEYSVEIEWNGDTYISQPQKPINSSPIDSIYFTQPEEEGEIGIYLSTTAKEEEKADEYYLWHYEEDWELRANRSSKYIYDAKGDSIIIYPEPPYARGWVNNSSKQLLIGSTETNNGNKIIGKHLYAIPSNDHRVSYLYSTLVTQRNLSKGEYEYYLCRERLDYEMGGLFTPQPTELPGNIMCKTSPEKRIIGYVGCNMNISQQRIFIKMTDINYTYYANCTEKDMSTTEKDMVAQGYQISSYNPLVQPPASPYKWVLRECVDVRVWGGIPDSRPDFWPKDNY